MSKITKLDPNYDLWLTYSWSNNNHGICGHTFEVIDYYHILKQYFRVGILIAEEMDWPTLEVIIRNKYDFSESEIKDIQTNTVFSLRPQLVKGRNILITDGGTINMSSKVLIFDNIFYFACGNKEIKNNDRDNVWILQDDRVYEPVKKNGINYKKKILFDRLKSLTNGKDSVLVYATKNCRNLDSYEELRQYGNDILVITNKENKPDPIPGFTFVVAPVDNLFEQFNTYVYTPVKRKWDCSPRFIAECKYYKKSVVFHNIDYWNEDRGLYWRNWDIENDFDSLHLKPSDDLVNILKGIITCDFTTNSVTNYR
jgi:hypothetical protein